VPLGVVGGAALATYLAFLVARRRLRATLGPLICSFPGTPGRPRRCRRCGGELPLASGAAFVECVYCRAANLSSRALAADDARRMRDDTDRAQLYAAATATRVEAAGRTVARLFTAATLAGMGLGGLLGSTLATYA
jgi:hypothetical protein